jgi:formamidopyrimidine-DNA glycosylase
MSIELPEANILAKQMDEALKGKKVRSYALKDYEKMQRIGFINRDLGDFDGLVGRTVENVTSRGNTVMVKMDGGMNLLIAPEYGGVVLYHACGKDAPKFHLRLDFTDGSLLTVRMTSMGIIHAVRDDALGDDYMYKRDFSGKPSPGSPELTPERFTELLTRGSQLKPLLVGKDAVVVGLGNSAFQDILYRASINPRRKASELNMDEVRALHGAIHGLVEDRMRLGGKDEFIDLYGKRGRYAPMMGTNMKDRSCPRCGTKIEKMPLGGGHVYYCPKCQK